jgi:hypothetical protein
VDLAPGTEEVHERCSREELHCPLSTMREGYRDGCCWDWQHQGSRRAKRALHGGALCSEVLAGLVAGGGDGRHSSDDFRWLRLTERMHCVAVSLLSLVVILHAW